MTDIVDWPGLSGTKYRYWVLENPRNADRIQAVGGNYAFVKKLPNSNYIPIYFGVADSLRDRIPNHERLDDARSPYDPERMPVICPTCQILLFRSDCG